MAGGRRAPETHQKGEPETDQQGAESNHRRTSHHDERQNENQSSVRNDEVVETPQRAQYVVCAAGVGDRSLLDRVINQGNPKWEQHHGNRDSHDQRDDDGAAEEGWGRGWLAVITLQKHEREYRQGKEHGPEEERGMVGSGSSHE